MSVVPWCFVDCEPQEPPIQKRRELNAVCSLNLQVIFVRSGASKTMAVAATFGLLTVVGCSPNHIFRTSSFIRLAPAKMHISAEPIGMKPSVIRDREALATMPVQSGTSGCIALIDVDGMLINQNITGLGSMGENPIDLFREKLDQVQRHGGIRAVLLRINSYGGGVTASDIMRRELVAFKERSGIPVVAILMDVSTGGAYYLATAADRIVAHPTTLLGGFGVIFNIPDASELMAQLNLFQQNIKSGDKVDIGTNERETAEEEIEILKEIADQYAKRFKEVVVSRNAAIDSDSQIFDGRVFTGQTAAKLGLIDAVGYVDDAIAEARGFVGNPNAGVIMLHRPQDKARTPYAVTPNQPYDAIGLPNIPGLSRSRMPTFLYMWQPDPSLVP